ncbi:MAG: crossover junction endodeoxyribonuclease RuvC [Alphaproteobacteria bacterium]|nr:crossover junction endodeoxyribonuclease RuvC [Alphaproteobacteria bacterium]NCQ66837.1 crossover junction endodeoxyribonuclease RuvC [Alphaproteobacteria bacterium]NCT07405.1 crossover junction endodeoxyribonuclease RuvC [Alphaproteobacteria bacterium]
MPNQRLPQSIGHTLEPRRILGLDPGLRLTGWGLIECRGHRLTHIAHGTIKVKVGQDLDLRLKDLFEGLSQVIQNLLPHEAAVEETFLNKNPATTLKLGLARGIVMLAPAAQGIRVGEYSANHVKKTVVGAGHADKEQVKTMINYLLPACGELSYDEADALAVAICHAHTLETQQHRRIAS